MDGPDLIYHGTWMGHFSFKIGTWMGDGWWHFKIPRGTPLPRPKLSTPPGINYYSGELKWATITLAPGGVLNFGLGRGVPLGILKCHHPSPCTNFEGKVTHPCTTVYEVRPIHVPRCTIFDHPYMYLLEKFTHEGTGIKLKLQPTAVLQRNSDPCMYLQEFTCEIKET